MSQNIKIKLNGKEINLEGKHKGFTTFLEIPVKIKVVEGSFLHIGTTKSPLTKKKTSVFKVDRTPVIPASSFKGALRNQLELLFIKNESDFIQIFDIPKEKKDLLKPCIPSTDPSIAEEELITKNVYSKCCSLKVEKEKITLGKNNGICPICYFMGSSGIIGFLRINNFYPLSEGSVIEQTNIRIDRKVGNAAPNALVQGEQVKSGTIFASNIDIIISDPILESQNIKFGDARKLGSSVIDKWLVPWKLTNSEERIKNLIENVMIPAIENIKVLGGFKSKGAGKVNVTTFN